MDANERYNETIKEIEAKMKQMSELIEAHKNQCTVKHWGHVGDVVHVNQELGTINEFLS